MKNKFNLFVMLGVADITNGNTFNIKNLCWVQTRIVPNYYHLFFIILISLQVNLTKKIYIVTESSENNFEKKSEYS